MLRVVLATLVANALLSRAADTKCDLGHECKNGADCIKARINGQLKNVCICTASFTGWDCSVPLDYCNKHCRSYSKDVPCRQALCNRGACNNIGQAPYYSCDCGPFYTGTNCEIEYNPCNQAHANPCEHGNCTFIRGTNQVLCQCHSGWATNPNQQVIKINWNGADILLSPPCTERIRRGITGTAPSLGPRAKVLWYTVFFISLSLFLWILSSMVYRYIS